MFLVEQLPLQLLNIISHNNNREIGVFFLQRANSHHHHHHHQRISFQSCFLHPFWCAQKVMCLLDSFRASFLVEISSLLLFPIMSRPHSLSAPSFAESHIPLHGTAIAIKFPLFALHILPFCACQCSFSSDEKGKMNNPQKNTLLFFSPLLSLTCAYNDAGIHGMYIAQNSPISLK